MAERSIAAVLKTVEAKTSGGSNPSLSASLALPCILYLKLSFFQIFIAGTFQGQIFQNITPKHELDNIDCCRSF